MISNTTNLTRSSATSNLNNGHNDTIALPNINENVTTKGQSKLSEEDIKKKLLEMARQKVASGERHNNPYRSNSAEWLKLEKDYVSFASPDRKGIINNTLSGLTQKLRTLMPKLKIPNNLLDFLMLHHGLFRSKDIGDNFIHFNDANGNVIAKYSQMPNGSWGITEFPTTAETWRSREFMDMWYDAQVQAGEEKRNAETLIGIAAKGKQIDIGKLLNYGSYIDMGQLAKHGITFDAETGQTHIDSEKLEQMYYQSSSQTYSKFNSKA